MAKRSTDERRLPSKTEPADGGRAPSPSERRLVREATDQVIERRREVLEELAKH